MTAGWRDAQRRESAASAIRDARRRLACTVTLIRDLDGPASDEVAWRGYCARCERTVTHPTVAEYKTWAVQHECKGTL